jgi:hypothetical protein
MNKDLKYETFFRKYDAYTRFGGKRNQNRQKNGIPTLNSRLKTFLKSIFGPLGDIVSITWAFRR